MDRYRLSQRLAGIGLVVLFLVGCGASATNDYSNVVKLGVIQGPSEGIASVASSPDGSIVAYGNYSDNSVRLVDVSTGKEIMTLEGHATAVTSLAFSPDGRLLASTGTVNLPPDKDGTVRIWNISTGQQLAVFETPGINGLAFSPDGALLAGAGVGDPVQIILWDVETLSEKKTVSNVFNTISFSPDGGFMASGSRDEAVHIFEVATGKEVISLSGHNGLVSATIFSPNGELLASGGDDTTIQVWNTKTGKRLKSLTGHTTAVDFLAFSPDGRVLASLGSGIKITRSGGQIELSFSSEDKFVRFWDIEAGQQIGSIELPEGISVVSFNPEWTLIATGTGEGVIQLWGVKK